MTKTMLAILKILEQHPDKILGSRAISRQLKCTVLTSQKERYDIISEFSMRGDLQKYSARKEG